MILPEWRACGFSRPKPVIKNEFNVLPAKCVLVTNIRARKFIFWHRIKIITLFPISDCRLRHYSSNVLCLRWGKSFVHKLWNCVLTHCCASCPVAEMHCCIVHILLTWCIDSATSRYLGSSELLKNGVESKFSVHIWWDGNWIECGRHWREILRCVCASLREMEVIMSIDICWKNNSIVVLNLCQK